MEKLSSLNPKQPELKETDRVLKTERIKLDIQNFLDEKDEEPVALAGRVITLDRNPLVRQGAHRSLITCLQKDEGKLNKNLDLDET